MTLRMLTRFIQATARLLRPRAAFAAPRMAILALASAFLPTAPAAAQPLFIDATTTAGLTFTGSYGAPLAAITEPVYQMIWRNIGNGAAVADFDRDGDLDIYLLGQLGQSNRLLRNNLSSGSKTFTDVTQSPLDDLGMSRVAHFADLNNDGLLDLVLINDDDGTENTKSKILRNNGDLTFTDVTPGSGFSPFGYVHGGCALADFDRDGLLDIYITVWSSNGVGESTFPGSNQLFRNLGDFRFQDVSASTGLAGLDRYSFSAIFKDFGDDLFPDLYVAIDNSSDEFYRNGAGSFVNATLEVGVEHIGNDMGVAVADFDDDGDLDLYVTNITDPNGVWGTTPFNVLYVDTSSAVDPTLFVDEAVARGAEDSYWGWGTQFVDVDNDSDLDLVAVNGFDEYILAFEGPSCALCFTPPVLLVNDGTGSFTRLFGTGLDDPIDSRALIAFDYDRDGDQDLLITNVDQPVKLMENVTPDAGNWLTIIPEPPHLAVGATVYATVAGTIKRRDVVAGRSYLSGTPNEVHFGLADATSASEVRVVWADGSQRNLGEVAANQILRVRPDGIFADGFESGDTSAWYASLPP